MQLVKGTAKETTDKAVFPFLLEDIDYWVIRRKNGETIRWRLDSKSARRPESYYLTPPASGTAKGTSTYYGSLGRFCDHDPAILPVFEADGLQLRIGDNKGTSDHWTEHDLVIDAGAVLSEYDINKNILLGGDAQLRNRLASFVSSPAARVLKIRWADRAACPLPPAFWPALLKVIQEEGLTRILTACQGGHGRSGTSLVALMMCLSDYSPLDGITHLRAMHCPRAIESVEQHNYLNQLGAFLGRPENALEAKDVKDFQARLLTMTSPFAAAAQERIKSGQGASAAADAD